jgi:hypothetical protein
MYYLQNIFNYLQHLFLTNFEQLTGDLKIRSEVSRLWSAVTVKVYHKIAR